jgi:hypothetical protein
MARLITLKLVNEEGTPHPWPGTPTQHEIGTQQSAKAVWIGVSADGNTNQVYPLSTSPATITATWPRLFQGVQLNTITPGDDSPAQVLSGEFVYYVSLEEFHRLEAACCIAAANPESPSSCSVQVDWIHFTGAGNLFIEVNGDTVLNQGAGSGSFDVQEGDTVHVVVSGGVSLNALGVGNDVDGSIYSSNNGSGEFGEDFTFNVLCGRIYSIGAQTEA